jgi:hypothetical protein
MQDQDVEQTADFVDAQPDRVRSRALRVTAASERSTTHGALMPFIAAGRIAAGDTVTWHRRQRGELDTATIDEEGRMVTADGAVFLTPDTCESTTAGYPCKGWRNWRTAAGETLQQLREGKPLPSHPPARSTPHRRLTSSSPLGVVWFAPHPATSTAATDGCATRGDDCGGRSS